MTQIYRVNAALMLTFAYHYITSVVLSHSCFESHQFRKSFFQNYLPKCLQLSCASTVPERIYYVDILGQSF